MKRMFFAVIIVVIFFVLRAGTMYFLVVTACNDLVDLYNRSPIEEQPLLEFGEGYYISDHYTSDRTKRPKFGGTPIITDSFRNKNVKREDVIKVVKENMPKRYSDFTTKLPKKIITELNKIETSRVDFEISEYDAPMAKLGEYRATSHFWADLGRLMVKEGKETPALAMSAGILLFAHNIERSPDNGSELIIRLISAGLRNIGNSLLLEQMNETKLSGKQIKAWIPKFQELRKGILPLEDAFKTVGNLYETGGRFLISKARISGRMLRGRKKEFAKLNSKTVDKLLESIDLKYSEKKKVHYKVSDHLDSLYFTHTISKEFITKLLLSPSQTVADHFGFHHYANFSRAHEAEAKSLQLADGVIAMMIIKAYTSEVGRMPDSLKQVEDWYGEKLPGDIFADDAPLKYDRDGKKVLYSVGPDMKAGTEDDLVFMPLSY